MNIELITIETAEKLYRDGQITVLGNGQVERIGKEESNEDKKKAV